MLALLLALLLADVSNLPRNFAEADVHRLFSQYGTLTEVTQHKRGDGQSKGCFFVSFATTMEGQQAARALHNYLLPGTQRPMTVRPSTSRRREARSDGMMPTGFASGGLHYMRTPMGGPVPLEAGAELVGGVDGGSQ